MVRCFLHGPYSCPGVSESMTFRLYGACQGGQTIRLGAAITHVGALGRPGDAASCYFSITMSGIVPPPFEVLQGLAARVRVPANSDGVSSRMISQETKGENRPSSGVPLRASHVVAHG